MFYLRLPITENAEAALTMSQSIENACKTPKAHLQNVNQSLEKKEA